MKEYFAYKNHKLVAVSKEEFEAMIEEKFADLRASLIAFVPASEQDWIDDHYGPWSLTSKIPVAIADEWNRIANLIASLSRNGYAERVALLREELGK